MRVGRRIQRHQVHEGVSEGAVALQRAPGAQGEAAQAGAQPVQAPGDRGAHGQHGLARGHQVREGAGDAPAAPVDDLALGGPAVGGGPGQGSSGASSSARAAPTKSAGSPITVTGSGSHGRAWRRTSRGDDRPVPGVDLEAEGGVDRLVGRDGSRPPLPKATARAAHAPGVDGEARRAGPRPWGAGRRTWRPGSSSVIPGLPTPKGASRSSSSARSSPSTSPGTTASTRSTGRRSSSVSTAAACASKRRGRRRARSARTSRPAAARWPPWRSRCPAPASSPASRSKAGMERPEPVPRSPSRATSTPGRWWRSAMREATMPDHAGVPSLAGQHVGGAVRRRRRPAPRPRRGSESRRRGARRWRGRARRRSRRARSSSSVSSELEPGVGALAAARRR